MSVDKDIFADYPQQVRAGAKEASSIYKLSPELYALHGRQAGTSAPGVHYLLNNGTIAVFKGTPDKAAVSAPERLGPVYALQPGGAPAVPTGLVFIRLRDGVRVGEREEEMKKAGYEIAERLDYASNAAWLRARSGNIADALEGIDALKEIPDAEDVEPQMLMESARR
jgi:hypothetical protein